MCIRDRVEAVLRKFTLEFRPEHQIQRLHLVVLETLLRKAIPPVKCLRPILSGQHVQSSARWLKAGRRETNEKLKGFP